MILTFFAILCVLLWLHISSIKDDAGIIPGIKMLLLLFAATLVLVDAYMFVEVSRAVDLACCGGNCSGNTTCVPFLGTATVVSQEPQFYVANGSVVSGDAASTWKENDGDEIRIMEDNSIPAAEVYANFTTTGFTHFNIHINGENPNTVYVVEFQRPADGVWVPEYGFTGDNDVSIYLNGTTYVNVTYVATRITTTDTGSSTYFLVIDWFVLEEERTYCSYQNNGEDTKNIYIYHQMETSLLAVILSILPYIGMLIFTFLAIQTLMLMTHFNDKKGKI